MALSDKKVNIIIADAKAGRYETITKLVKHHKISRNLYYSLEKKYNFKYGDNLHIVEAGIVLEQAKKSTKKVQEVHAIEKAIAERVNTIETDNKLIENNRVLLLESQKALKKSFEDDEVTAGNIKQITGAIKDIEAVANPQASKTEVNVQQSTQVQQTITVEWE